MLQGKKGIVLGVANKRSIAWAIAKKAADEGAQIALTYQDERLLEKVKPLADELRAPLVLQCDVGNAEQMDQLFRELERGFGPLDFVVHALAFAKREELQGDFDKMIAASNKTKAAADDLSSAAKAGDQAAVQKALEEGNAASAEADQLAGNLGLDSCKG